MKAKPILIVAGDPDSIFFEIFFKSIKLKRYKSPLILICNIDKLKSEMKRFNFKKDLRVLNFTKLKKTKLDNKKINLVNIELKNTSNLNKNLKITQLYIKKSFDIAFKLIKNRYSYKLLNGPINKKNFLNSKYLGVTEYVASQFNQKKNWNVDL